MPLTCTAADARFLSTPSGWRATTAPRAFTTRCLTISIHALRVEGDKMTLENLYQLLISIHALRVEGDSSWMRCKTQRKDFYPRPPGGGRRSSCTPAHSPRPYFYPRPPGGGRQRRSSTTFLKRPYFYPRPPGGGRHRREKPALVWCEYFYPRPPGGGRLVPDTSLYTHAIFLSTPSGWRATGKEIKAEKAAEFLSTPSGWRATFTKVYTPTAG